MKRTIFTVLTCLLLASMMLLSACGQEVTEETEDTSDDVKTTETDQSTQEEEEPVEEAEERTLVVGYDAEPESINPHASSVGRVLQLGEFMHGTLLKFSEDNSGAVVPAIAASWDYLSETELQIKLREDVYFHNGRNLTADDIVFTFEWVLDPENGSVRNSSFSGVMDSVEKTGEYEVVFKLLKPYPPTLELLTYIFIIGEDTVDTLDDNPIGCGPFEFVSWDKGQQITFEKFDMFYDAGSIQYDELVVRCFQDYSSEMTAFLAGEVDVFMWLSNVDIPTVMARSDDFYVQGIDDYAWYMSCNTKIEVLQNDKVREALKYALDKQTAIDMVLAGQGTPISQMVASTNAYYNTDLDWDYDLERAKQALIDAGYPDGVELVLSTQNTTVLRDLATVVKEQLEAAGFKIELNIVESAAMFELWNAGGVEIALGGFGFYQDPAFRTQFLNGPEGFSAWLRHGYENPKYYELYLEALETTDVAARKAIYTEMAELQIDEAGFLMICSSTGSCAVKSNIEGFVYRSSGNADFTKITFKD